MKTLAERFRAKVHRTATCWLWTGAKNNRGYGVIGGGRALGHAMLLAHRVAWDLWCGVLGSDLLVLHRCDTPLCVNPMHLFLGTHADNTADKLSKGRQARGSRHGSRKLTDCAVSEIRAARASGVGLRALSTRYGVGTSTISNICNNRTWKQQQTTEAAHG